MVTITIKDSSSVKDVRMEAEPDETIDDLIVSASEYLKKDPNMFVLKKGKQILISSETVAKAGLVTGDVLVLTPDPEGGSE